MFIYSSEYHRKAPILINDNVINASSRLWWSSDGTEKSDRTGLGGNGSNCLPVIRKYCCIAEFRSVNLFSSLHPLII